MSTEQNPPAAARQGFGEPWRERLPLPEAAAMNEAQRAAAEALVAGPRKGIYGPFLPLLRSHQLLERVAGLGELLRFQSVVDVRLRELVTCAVARHVSNQFEWQMHAPLAIAAGIAATTLEAIRVGARPRELPVDEETALDFTRELLHTHGTSEPTYAAAARQFGEQGVVELTMLIGYFVMVSWVMNVAHTPARMQEPAMTLPAFPQ
jgi:4-carboxymuconolactone decarboxylase